MKLRKFDSSEGGKTVAMCALRRFLRQDGGSMVAISAAVLPLIAACAAYAIETANLIAARVKLQSVTDSAALATVKEMAALGESPKTLESVVRSYAHPPLNISADGELQVKPEKLKNGLKLSLRQHAPLIFGKLVNRSHPWIRAEATAEMFGESKVCLLALDESANNTLQMNHSAALVAPDCSVVVNSTHAKSISMAQDSFIDSPSICTAGGVATHGAKGEAFSSEPITDCPKFPDPLSGRVVAADASCDQASKVTLSDVTDAAAYGFGTRDISGKEFIVVPPGSYCGGITISNSVHVFFDPGIVYLVNGKLQASGDSFIRGDNVSFHLSGNGAVLDITGNADIELSAQEIGPLAGLLFYDKSAGGSKPIMHTIKSPNVRELVGTLYLPNGWLFIDTATQVASGSAFTIMVVKSMKMLKAPHIVFNTDYDATDVPVPAGMVQAGSKQARLTR